MTEPVAPPGAPSASPATAPRVMCIGSAALDVLMEIDAMPPEDGRIAARDGMLAGGGPAATAAVALATLGIPTGLISVVGDDIAGDLILSGLAQAGVRTEWIRRAAGARSALSVGLIRPSPGNTRSLVALAPIGTTLGIDAAALEACRAADWIHVDHAGWPLVAWLRQRGVRTPVSVDGGNPLTPADLSDADLYVPGETELLRSTGCADVATALDAAMRRGARLIVVTRGAAGSSYLGDMDPSTVEADEAIRTRRSGTGSPAAVQLHQTRVTSPAVDVRSTLGAGDVYHGALLAGLLRGRSIRGSMAYASTAAALSCRALDGRSAIPTDAEVAEALRTGSSGTDTGPTTTG